MTVWNDVTLFLVWCRLPKRGPARAKVWPGPARPGPAFILSARCYLTLLQTVVRSSGVVVCNFQMMKLGKDNVLPRPFFYTSPSCYALWHGMKHNFALLPPTRWLFTYVWQAARAFTVSGLVSVNTDTTDTSQYQSMLIQCPILILFIPQFVT